MKVDGTRFEALCADLDAALRELSALIDSDQGLWARGLPNKWTAGQHVEHLAMTLAATADPFEQSEQALRRGELGPPPRRWPLQALWVALVVGWGRFPRGIKTPRAFEPSPPPDPDSTLGRLRRDADRHRLIGARLSPGERDRLWVRNPFLKRWHYTLPEIIRVHAVHVRHHTRGIAEIAAGR